MKDTFLKIILTVIGLPVIFLFNTGISEAALNNSLVISDYSLANNNTWTAQEINSFFHQKESGLADYVIPEYVDVPYPLASGGFGWASSRQVNDLNGDHFYGKTVAQLIYDESVEHDINPKVILATLEKESSAITGSIFRSSTVATWPMFYMYDETMASCLNQGVNCNDEAYRQRSLDYGGMGRQLGYSIGWFGKKYQDYKGNGRCIGWNGSACTGGYEQYNDPISIDSQTITCQSIGTRILYLYTPHIQTSFFNIYTNFFGDPTAGAPPPAANDIAPYVLKTYSDGDVRISGVKTVTTRAYLDTFLIADLDTSSWTVLVSPNLGTDNRSIIYKDESGNEIARKTVTLIRQKVGDISGDGAVDINDLAIFAENWGETPPSETLADLNSDGTVDITDLAVLAENWGK